MNQNINGEQTPQKDNTLKIVLIIVGIVGGVLVVGVAGFLFLFYTIFNKSVELIDETKEDIREQYEDNNNSSSSGNHDNNDDNTDGEDFVIQENYSNIEQLSFKNFKRKIEKKESFVILISQTTCYHCIAFKPTYNEVFKKNNTVGYELDLLTLTQDERLEFVNMLEIDGTPTTLIYIDGVVQKEKKIGVITETDLTNYLSKYGFIRE
jgi:thiol-disulfide isomerase/thioredoxin